MAQDNIKNKENTEFLPIRSVVEKTGIHAVTLRAWERRYGLIKPQRTPKGHRVYTMADVEKIQEITTWLDKGVSISRVLSLIVKPELKTDSDIEEGDSENWQLHVEQWQKNIIDFQDTPITQRLLELSSLYPLSVLHEKLIYPLQKQLQWRWANAFGASAEKSFFYFTFEQHFMPILAQGNRQNQKNKHSKGCKSKNNQIIVTNLCGPVDAILGLLASVICTQAGYKATFLRHDIHPLSEIHVSIKRLNPTTALLLGDCALNTKSQHEIEEVVKQPSTQWIFIGDGLTLSQSDIDPLIFHRTFKNLRAFGEFLSADKDQKFPI